MRNLNGFAIEKSEKKKKLLDKEKDLLIECKEEMERENNDID